jgi:hypothetical protein
LWTVVLRILPLFRIVALDTQKGPGPDGISPQILKKIVLVVKKPVAILFNLSLLSGVVQCVRKESFVVALFKSRDNRNISSYRRIPILSAIRKRFEKLVCDGFTPIIRPSISDEQHGFVGGRTMGASLVEFSNFLLGEMEDVLQVDVVYIDFLNAFVGCCWAG